MEESVVSIGYDVKKMPLGEVCTSTVLKAYNILGLIEKELTCN